MSPDTATRLIDGQAIQRRYESTLGFLRDAIESLDKGNPPIGNLSMIQKVKRDTFSLVLDKMLEDKVHYPFSDDFKEKFRPPQTTT